MLVCAGLLLPVTRFSAGSPASRPDPLRPPPLHRPQLGASHLPGTGASGSELAHRIGRPRKKDERGAGYAKAKAIAGRHSATWSELDAHLAAWTRDVADARIYGTAGEAPALRFERDNARVLRPLSGIPPFINGA